MNMNDSRAVARKGDHWKFSYRSGGKWKVESFPTAVEAARRANYLRGKGVALSQTEYFE